MDEPSPGLLRLGRWLLWSVMLAVMAGTGAHRYAGRWGWFWLYTVGLSGVLLHLLLEPRPLWTRGGGDLGPPARRLNGTTGLLAAIPLGLITLGALFGLRAVVS
ncbi:hypothetical protein BJF79_06270 [Actinomadura sp. CNU-125]|uniref:hypothetical protein n=1 Tax=Actinomadura sp. CNU-125 TaxID=1904961 RepID=UPI00096814C7|nr:hypothetical protein [Actinomadura sp. CNU-125]OLT36976.1 hypothetical protein BJF79_06270 [Actinomadura sp. CNU-125]